LPATTSATLSSRLDASRCSHPDGRSTHPQSPPSAPSDRADRSRGPRVEASPANPKCLSLAGSGSSRTPQCSPSAQSWHRGVLPPLDRSVSHPAPVPRPGSRSAVQPAQSSTKCPSSMRKYLVQYSRMLLVEFLQNRLQLHPRCIGGQMQHIAQTSCRMIH